LKTSSALKIKIFEDADGSNLTTTDRVAKRWTSSTYLGSVSNVNLVNTLTDTNGIVEDIGAGNFIINCIDSSGWNFIQHYSNAASTSDTSHRASISLIEGRMDSVTFIVYKDQSKFRTFKATTLLNNKAVKLKYKKGSLVASPNLRTALENVFAKIGKSGTTFLGVVQTNSDSAKTYGWIYCKKAGDIGKYYSTTHTGMAYPIDSLRASGKKSKKFTKALKADPKYDNVGWDEGIMFRLNLLASQYNITPPNFGTLVLDTAVTLFGRNLQGKQLSYIANYFDSLMTYYDRFGIGGVDRDNEYAQLTTFATNVLRPINNGFYTDLSASNYEVDSTGVVDSKNAYAMVLKGIKTPLEVGKVRKLSGKQEFVMPTIGYQENIPNAFELHQNFPNPFNPSTIISFKLLKEGFVTLKVYNELGQEIATLLNNQYLDEGENQITFDANKLSSGVYFYRLNVNNGEFISTKKLVLMK